MSHTLVIEPAAPEFRLRTSTFDTWLFRIGHSKGELAYARVMGETEEVCSVRAKRFAAALTMYNALQKVLAWMSNANTAEPSEIAVAVINALEEAGADENQLDDAALAILHGVAGMGGKQ